jgi:hypothetical protein
MDNPLAMVLGPASPAVCPERIEAAFRAGDREGAVAAIWQVGVQIMDGEAGLALAQLTAWVGFAALVMPVFTLFRALGHRGATGRAAHLLGATTCTGVSLPRPATGWSKPWT